MLFFTYRRSTKAGLEPDSIVIMIDQKILHQIVRLLTAVAKRTALSAFEGFGLLFDGW